LSRSFTPGRSFETGSSGRFEGTDGAGNSGGGSERRMDERRDRAR
jgi:hypothetical protein